MLQVLDSGIAGFANDGYEFSPTSKFSFDGSSITGSPLISISNNNFFSSPDAKSFFLNTINFSNNINLRRGDQPAMDQMRHPGNVPSYQKFSALGKLGKLTRC